MTNVAGGSAGVDSSYVVHEAAASDAMRAVHPGVVRRDRLLRDLAAVPDDVPLILVIAGAGYGKTIALRQWMQQDPRAFGWVNVERSDSDPIRLLRRIASALHDFQLLDDAVWRAIASQGVSALGVVVPRLVASTATNTTPWLLVLDDLHTVEGSAGHDAIVALALGLRPGCHVVIASRTRPGPRFDRLRDQGLSVEFGTETMAFDHGEAAAVLAATAGRLPSDAVHALVRRTEGWPAGLYLAALSIRDRPDLVAAAAEIAGTDKFITEYFREEVLTRETPETVRFLLRTAPLDQLSGDLCDAVLGQTGSATRLADLAARNLFVAAQDGAGQWYRYHRMLAEMLTAELHRREPREEIRLHQRAAAWYEAHEQTEHAVAHALAGRDTHRAARLVTMHGQGMVSDGRIVTVRGWLDALQAGAMESYPPLAVTAAWIWALTGEPSNAQRCLLAAEQGTFEGVPPDGSASMDSAIARIRAALAPYGVERMLVDAQHAFDLEPPGSRWHVVAASLLGSASGLNGSDEAAMEALDYAAVLGRETLPTAVGFALAQLALLAAKRLDWSLAEACATEAAELVDALHLSDFMPSVITYAARATVAVHHADTRTARRNVGNALRLYADPSPAALPWLAAQSAIVLGRLLLDLDEIEAARSKATEARRHLARMPTEGVLRQQQRELSDDVARRAGRRHRPNAMNLTPAELRVLRLLPTHLTLGEIADELHTSRHTVKTQVASVYSKLGTSTRTEAVREGRSVGLLEP